MSRVAPFKKMKCGTLRSASVGIGPGAVECVNGYALVKSLHRGRMCRT